MHQWLKTQEKRPLEDAPGGRPVMDGRYSAFIASFCVVPRAESVHVSVA